MKAVLRYILAPLSLVPILFLAHTTTVAQTQAQAARPWQQVTVPSTSEVAANFKSPPHEYGAIAAFTSWNGADPAAVRQRITADLDRMSANGMFIFNMSPGKRSPGEPAYLSPGHMDQVKFTVAEAAKRNMRMWLQDESDYPSGFAGGYISERYPQLGMQILSADLTLRGGQGQTLEMPVPANTMAIWATKTDRGGVVQTVMPVPVPANLQLKWITPSEKDTSAEERGMSWQLTFLRHVYFSSPTRNFNRADGSHAKDGLYSLIDYLDPKATDAYLHITHETYYGAVGDQFGKTILGFFGDEPAYNGTPWTPTILEQFKAQKGYDVAPYVPQWFNRQSTEQSRRASADYSDVWSNIFKDSFFGEQANWAKAHNVEYLVHLVDEENMIGLERGEGEYFRDERYVQVPGIDNLDQLVPSAVHRADGTWSTNNNFPKLASSAAHLFGKPKAWSEEGGGSGVDGKYQMNFQLVRGINALQVRVSGLRAGGGEGATGQASDPSAGYATNNLVCQSGRLSDGDWPSRGAGRPVPAKPYRMAGRPGRYGRRPQHDEARLAVIRAPGGLGLLRRAVAEFGGNAGEWRLQEPERAGLQGDRVSVDDGDYAHRTGAACRRSPKQGGKVIFVGKTPSLIMDKTFLDVKEKPDLSFATLIEPSGDITPAVIAALPKPDVKLDSEFPRLTYTHRNWPDGDMYFFFNESNKAESRMATIAGHGKAQDWDLETGEIHPMAAATAAGDSVTFLWCWDPMRRRWLWWGRCPRWPPPRSLRLYPANHVADLSGDWKLDLNGKQLTTPIKPWEELGTTSFAGPATYSMQFTAAAAPKGKHVYLEIADVHDYAKVTLNGKEVGARSFQPYRWDVTGASEEGRERPEDRGVCQCRPGETGDSTACRRCGPGCYSACSCNAGSRWRGTCWGTWRRWHGRRAWWPGRTWWGCCGSSGCRCASCRHGHGRPRSGNARDIGSAG